MSLTLQNLFTNSSPRLAIHFPPKVSTLSRQFTTSLHFQSQSYTPQRLCALTCSNIRRPTRLQAYESDATIHGNDVVGGGFNFDSFLSIAELVCLVSSVAAVSVRFVACLCPKNAVLVEMGNRVSVWGLVLLAGGVAIGAWIRRRQWRRVCRQTVKGGLEVNLLERIEKLEEDLRSSATIIRVLSRQLEKLGIRFRVTRKSLKEPIAETVALSRKNSEATRALAVQEDILEKELGEIQKMLLAMQEQQQKQLELILAISKNGKLWESKREQDREQDATEIVNSTEVGLKQKETHQI